MLIPNHPNDERLSALASGDPEAVADSALSEHVASCVRCTDTVAELGALRAALAEMPDLQPHRPLQLLPPVPDAPARADRVGGWARRFFAPMLTAGAALALVGFVGTASPLLGGLAASGAADSGGQELRVGAGAPADASQDSAFEGTSAGDAESEGEEPSEFQPLQSGDAAEPDADSGGDAERLVVTDDRPVWPMLLFAGVAIMIAAALLRWILAPRAG
jgi:anti-sigma factor RsiW